MFFSNYLTSFHFRTITKNCAGGKYIILSAYDNDMCFKVGESPTTYSKFQWILNKL